MHAVVGPCGPSSTTLPADTTAILSASRIVDSRCAMITVVRRFARSSSSSSAVAGSATGAAAASEGADLWELLVPLARPTTAAMSKELHPWEHVQHVVGGHLVVVHTRDQF